MKHTLIRSAMVSGLLLVGYAAFAQDRGEDKYYQQNRDDAFWKGGHLFQRVRDDLDHIQAAAPAVNADQYQLAATKEELNRLQTKLDAGRFDLPEVDKVIAGVERVLSNNTLPDRARDMLTEDVRRLRDFRTYHDAYGAKEDDAFTK